MDISPRVERFTTVTAGDGSATFIICLSHTRCLSTSPLVFVNTTTMWDPDIYRWYMFAWSAALDRHGIVTREEDENDDDLGLVTVPLKLKFGMNLCTKLWFKA